MPSLVEVYERVTRMHVYERSPYAGALVFAGLQRQPSGCHRQGHEVAR